MHKSGPALICATAAMAVVTGCAGAVAPQAAGGSQVEVAASTAPSATSVPCSVPARFRGTVVNRLPVTGKVVALTFDAGANADGVPSIRSTLAAKHATATFFLTGRFVRTFPLRSTNIARQYLVGNHTDTHPDLTTLTDTAVRGQVRRAETTIRSTTGQDPRRFFRFPYGAYDAHLVTVVNGLCYVPFGWTVDSLGWKGTSGGMTVRKVIDRVLAAAQPGAIVLMHVGSNPDDHTTLDAAALPAVIDGLRAKGYGFVALSRVMSAAP